jgi:hypothetical protein
VPLIGLFAETARCGGLKVADLSDLREIASLDESKRRTLFISADRFLAHAPIAPEGRRRLLRILDRRGIQVAVSLIDDGTVDATVVSDELGRVSGIEQLERLIYGTFLENADVLKAAAALAQLDGLGKHASEGSTRDGSNWIRDGAERLRFAPSLARITLLWAVQEAERHEDALPDALRADLHRFASHGSVAERLGMGERADAEELAAAAGAAAEQWRSFVGKPFTSFDGKRIGEAVCRSYETLWSSLQAEDPHSAHA